MGAQSVMAVGRPGRAQPRKGGVNFRHRDRAFRDVHELVNIATKKADDAVLGVNGDAVSIGVWKRRRHDRTHGRLAETRDASHGLFDLLLFQFQLSRVVELLVTASAATAEKGTRAPAPARGRST